MKKRLRLLQIISYFFVIVILLFSQVKETVFADQNQKAKSPEEYVVTGKLPFTIKAPWPATISFHAGKDGSFYNSPPGHRNTSVSRDFYALDFNGDTSSKEPKIDNGALVLAISDGIVKTASFSAPKTPGTCNYGWNVVIIHTGGYESRYAHLRSNPLVKQGEWVAQGTPLGYIGDSGCSGEHLHFAMYYCDPNLSEVECNNPNNRYAVLPEPFDGLSEIKDGEVILSTNYGVGYEQIASNDIYDVNNLNKLWHKDFLETYQILGGQDKVFGPSDTPVQKWTNSNFFFQEFSQNINANSSYNGLKSALFDDGQIAYFIVGPIWDKYKEINGPLSSLGLPISHSYPWGSTLFSTTPQGYRNDFQYGSIIWDKNQGITVLDKNNTDWDVSIFSLPNFSDLSLSRRDQNINFKWTPVAYSSVIKNDLQLGSSIIAKASVDVGLVAIYQIVAEVQGNIEVISDGKTVLSFSSPDSVTRKTSMSLKAGKTNLEIRFSQSPLKQAKIKITAQGLGIVPQVYAADDSDITISAIPESPKPNYSGYEAPPYPDDNSTTTSTAEPYLPTNASSTVLVFDTSGSMLDLDSSGMEKIEAAKKAGAQILNVISAENSAVSTPSQIGIAGYSTTASIISPLTTDITTLQSELGTLTPTDKTAMADGLKTGLDLFGDAQDEKILILLSDGLPNIGLNTAEYLELDTIKQQVFDLATEAGKNNICIYTVGFGNPNFGIDSIDEEFLRQVADSSGCGKYFSALNAIDLANVYIELRHTSTGDIAFKQSGEISQDQEIDLGEVTIPSNQELSLFTLNWPGSKLDFIIKDPSGKLVDSNYPGVTISTSPTLVSIIMNNPQPGNWKMSILGEEVPEGITQYNAIVSTRAGSTVVQTSGKSNFAVPLLLLVIACGAVGIYVYSNSIKRGSRTGVGHSSGEAKLIGLSGETRNQSYILFDKYLIGRGSSCNLRINDTNISRSHAQFRYANGVWFIQDTGSKGGTYVNGQKVDAIRINNGDEIQIGSNSFTLSIGGK